MNKKQGFGVSHAKIILIGEHSVVYGYPGISLPFLVLKAKVNVRLSDEDTLISTLYKGPMNGLPQELLFIKYLVDELRTALHYGPVELGIENQIPNSAGMGSSAAISGAIVEALYDLSNTPLSSTLRFEKTQLAEKLVHGSASGIDALTTANNNAWYFIKGKEPESLKINLPAYLVVANTGVKGSTKEAVGKVAKLYSQNLAQAHLESLGLMAILVKEAIEKGGVEEIAKYMNQAHYHLQELEVSHPKLDSMVETANRLGALGAKLTGGGLGGSMIALFDNQSLAEKLVKHFQTNMTKEVWMMNLKA
ncbi:MAG: mevalonate kinase [Firmicutes bacterium]|nr:mevalonate kinase [Bacillota bacterium]